MTLDPQARHLLERFAAAPALDLETASAAQMRARNDTPGAFGPSDAVEHVEDLTLPGPAGTLRARAYRGVAGGALPLLLYFHGGGFVLGTLDTCDNICRCLAHRAGALVLSVDYRLAPEHPFPAAVEDACAALAWAQRHAAELGADPARIAVAGDSAGGNLAAVAAQHAGGAALRHQLLIYPVIDCRTDSGSYRTLGRDYGLTAAEMAWYYRQYLPDPVAAKDPRASPIRAATLAGLAPATVITAEYDPLRDEGEAYAHALRAAGVPTALHRWPGQIHGFAGMLGAVDAADTALDMAAQALRLSFGRAALRG